MPTVGNLNERQIDLRTGGNYDTLKAYMDGVEVIPGEFVGYLSTVSTNVVKIESADVGGGSIAVDSNTTQSNGAILAATTTTLGTAAIDNFTDGIGNILNAVAIRDSVTNEPITVDTGADIGRVVFGLIQTDAADGDTIAAAPNHNLQISFVYRDSSDTLTLYALNPAQTIEFNLNKVYKRRDLPVIHKAGGSASGGGGGGAAGAGAAEVLEASFLVTTAAATAETLTLATGAFSGTGVSTKAGDTIVLPAVEATALADIEFDVELNGISLIEGAAASGTQVEYASATTLKFNVPLDINDRIVLRATKI